MAAEKRLKGVLYGVHPVEEALRSGSRSVGALYLAEGARGGRLREIEDLARTRGLKVRRVDVRTLDRMVGGAVHQGVVVEAEARPTLDLDEVLAGAAAVLIPKDRSAGVTPVVVKVAAGGLEHVRVVRAGNIAQSLRRLKEEGFWIYGAAGEAGSEDLYRVDFAARAVLVLGEEHGGLRRLTRDLCDSFVRIPSSGVIDSFNLGTASGIILARMFSGRQHRSA